MTVWFTSDAHWGHRLVANIRGFASIEEHDATLLENFRAVVCKGDQVWWLGDMTVSRPDPAFAALAQIPGEHHLITGNHDRCNPMFRDSHRHLPAYLAVFASVQPFARRRVDGHDVLLSHYPYATADGEADRGEVRYEQYRLPDHGRWLLHGHTHMADQRVHGRQIHVGADAWGLAPVPLALIERTIRDLEARTP